ncbi:TPA: hypothetical protein ACYLLE_005068, partial [Burkholderia cenocepacia]
ELRGQVLLLVACSCDREKLLWLPKFTSGSNVRERSSPFGQFPMIKTGDCRPAEVDRLLA